MALERFLLDATPVASDGRVYSWVGDDAYPYDETTVLMARLTRWLGQNDRVGPYAEVVEERLRKNGCLGRDGIGYTFDTALALPVVARPGELAAQVAEWLTNGRACTGSPEARWSTTFGPHLIKAAAELAPFGHEPLARALVERWVETCFADGRFRVAPGSPLTYLHAHCYAVEGLVALGGWDDTVRSSLDWLAKNQAADGSFPAWSSTPFGLEIDSKVDVLRPSDVVAQAARLFAVVDPDRWALPLERALARLGAVQGPTGGLWYADGVPHVNVWASAFALQASKLEAHPPPPGARFSFV